MNFYTYAHYNNNEQPFYIGAGSVKNKRAYDYRNKSPLWHQLAANGVKVKVLAYFDNQEECYQHEEFLVTCFKDLGYILANKTSGGAGSNGYQHTEECKQHMRNKARQRTKIKCNQCNTDRLFTHSGLALHFKKIHNGLVMAIENSSDPMGHNITTTLKETQE
jgi:hypothetical protein